MNLEPSSKGFDMLEFPQTPKLHNVTVEKYRLKPEHGHTLARLSNKTR